MRRPVWNLRVLAVLCALLVGLAQQTRAERADDMAALFSALDIEGTIAVMRDEGLAHGKDVGDDMLREAETLGWMTTVARIYDADRMLELVRTQMAQALDDTDLAPLLAFFRSERGQQVIRLELEARRAFMDADVEAAAKARLEEGAADDAPLLDAIGIIIDDSDLIEKNVTGALNSNLMFYRGLADGGASDLGEQDILNDVWAQEEDLRTDTVGWLNSFLMTAYAPLDAEVLDDYAALYRTPEGRALNRAMFMAFNRMYDELSYLLGRAVAGQLESSPL